MSDIKNAYYAGLLDGEGSFTLKRQNATDRQRARYTPLVRCSMTHEETIRSIHDYFGVGQVHRKVKSNPKWKLQWEWIVYSREALAVVNRILPYMITKRADALRIVEHYG